MASDVVFDDDIGPYTYLDEGSFFISLRNKKDEISGRRTYPQIIELHRMGFTVDERVQKMKECLTVSLSEAREHFGLPDMLADEDGNYMEIMQHRLFFRMLLKPDEIVWVYTGKMLVPMWAVAHRQYWDEKQKEGFVEEYFFRGCLFAVLHVIENFSFLRHRLAEVPEDPPPFSKWFSPSLPANEVKKFRSAVQVWWSFSSFLMRLKKGKDYWNPVRKLFEYKVPAGLPPDEAHSWQCTFHDIISSNFDRDAHLAGFYVTIHSKISCVYLPYCIRSVSYRSIPTDVSKIEMYFSDETAVKKIDLCENLFFYTVAAMMFRCKSAHKLSRMTILNFLMNQRHVYTNHEKMSSVFKEELSEMAKTACIEYNNGFRFSKHNVHVFHFKNRSFDLSSLVNELEISQDCLDNIMEERENVRDCVSLLKETDILESSSFQAAMVNVAKCVFALSETYCGLKIKDEASEKRKQENLKKACFIKQNRFIQVQTPAKHAERVKDILSEAAELTAEVEKPLQMGTSYRDPWTIRGVGGMYKGHSVFDGSVARDNPPVQQIDQDEFFLSQQSMPSMFERWFCDALLYYSMPEFMRPDVKKTNFLVFLSPRHISTFPKEVVNKIEKHPWNYHGCMRTIPACDNDSANFAAYVHFARNMEEYVSFPSEKQNFASGIDMRVKLDEICGNCMNVRNFISSVSLITFGQGFDTFSYGLPGVGILRKTHYSWFPRTCDSTNFFGSRCWELNKHEFPLPVWSEDVVLAKRGPDTLVTRPIPCSVCATFSKTMYTCNHRQIDEFRCSSCTPGESKGPKECISWVQAEGWNAVTMHDDFGLVCGVGDSLLSTRHVVWTTGWKPSLKSDFSSLRKLSTSVSNMKSDASKKRTPTFLLGWSSKIPKLDGRLDVSHDLVFDWLDDEPEVLDPVWLDGQYAVRPKGGVSLHWSKIFKEVTKCKCCEKLKAWKISKRYHRPSPLNGYFKQGEFVRENGLGPRPCPTFLCCGKDVFLNSSLVSYLDDGKFARAKEILDFPPGNHDRHTLMRCNEFLKLYYTLFSERGRESSLREACSWRDEGDVPTHCMFFGEERLNIPYIRGYCMEVLGMDGYYYN